MVDDHNGAEDYGDEYHGDKDTGAQDRRTASVLCPAVVLPYSAHALEPHGALPPCPPVARCLLRETVCVILTPKVWRPVFLTCLSHSLLVLQGMRVGYI